MPGVTSSAASASLRVARRSPSEEPRATAPTVSLPVLEATVSGVAANAGSRATLLLAGEHAALVGLKLATLEFLAYI